jgi:hypothetical protein
MTTSSNKNEVKILVKIIKCGKCIIQLENGKIKLKGK